jgi:gentisate 1,2-dioxygenase
MNKNLLLLEIDTIIEFIDFLLDPEETLHDHLTEAEPVVIVDISEVVNDT